MPQRPIRRLMVHPWIGRVTRSVLALAFAVAFAATPQPGPNGNQPPSNHQGQDGGNQPSSNHQGQDGGNQPSNVNWNS
jgi:hypothetical protein